MLKSVDDAAPVRARGMGNWFGLQKYARSVLRYSFMFFFMKGMLWLALIALPFVT